MKKKIITARIRDDGTVVRVFADGKEKPFPVEPFEVWSDEQIEAAARKDPDNPPLTQARLAKMHRVPRVKTLRFSLGLSQEEFAKRYQIPLSALRDWEQGRTEPDQAARAYIEVIAHDPERVREILHEAQRKPSSRSPRRRARASA